MKQIQAVTRNRSGQIFVVLFCFSTLIALTLPVLGETLESGSDQISSPDALVGGEEAAPGAYPWAVALLDLTSESGEPVPPGPFLSQTCGGSLIASQWVLTSADCVLEDNLRDAPTVPFPPERLQVLIGEQDLTGSGGEIIAVEKVITHPDYVYTVSEYGPDIALLKLARPSSVTPAKYARPGDDPTTSETARILGWGALEVDNDGSGFNFPEKLRQLDFSIVDQAQCVESWNDVSVNVRDHHLCAAAENGGVNALDGGGPFFVDGPDGPIIVGIPSLSVGFGETEYPTLFTRVSQFTDWIEDNITTSLHFAQAGTGANSVSSDFVIQNVSTSQTVEGSIQFYDPQGADLELTFADGQVTSKLDFELSPLQSKTFSTDSTVPSLVLGSAVAAAIGEIAGVVRFTLAGTGIAGVSSSQPLSGAVVPARRQGDLNTAIAIRNTGSETLTVNATLLKDGQPVNNGTAVITLQPMGREARFINEIFNQANIQNFVGEVKLEAENGLFAALALELGTTAGQFTTLPVTALQE